MKIVEKNVSDLKEYDNNPRNNDGSIDAVSESIKQFGFKVPIVIDKDNVIIAGHTRLKAARKLDLKTVPCIIADDLSPEKIRAFRLVDNKTAELSTWDFDKLTEELDSISDSFDFDSFGFDDFDNIPDIETVELPREEIGTAEKLPSIKFGTKKILLTESESERFEEFYNNFLQQNGNVYGLIQELLDNGAKNYES